MQTSSGRDFSHESNAGRPTKRSVWLQSVFSLESILKSVGRKCRIFSGVKNLVWSHMTSQWCSHFICQTGRRFVWARATSSSYPPSSDSMTKVPTLGMATSTVRWPGDSSSVTRSGGGVEGVLTWTSGWGEVGGERDCRENWTDETEKIECWWKGKEH